MKRNDLLCMYLQGLPARNRKTQMKQAPMQMQLGRRLYLTLGDWGKGGGVKELARHWSCMDFVLKYDIMLLWGFFLIERILFVIWFYFINTNTHLDLVSPHLHVKHQTYFLHKFKTSYLISFYVQNLFSCYIRSSKLYLQSFMF